MKKILLALILTLCTPFMVSAHSICGVSDLLIDDNFEAGSLPPGWVSSGVETFSDDRVSLPVGNGATVRIQKTLPKSYRELWLSVPWKISWDFSLSPNTISNGPGIYKTDNGNLIAALGLRHQYGGLKFNYRYSVEGGNIQKVLSSPLPVPGREYLLTVHWKASENGKDFGIVEIYLDNQLIVVHREVDNDTKWGDTVVLGQAFGAKVADITGSYSFGEVKVGKTCK